MNLIVTEKAGDEGEKPIEGNVVPEPEHCDHMAIPAEIGLVDDHPLATILIEPP